MWYPFISDTGVTQGVHFPPVLLSVLSVISDTGFKFLQLDITYPDVE